MRAGRSVTLGGRLERALDEGALTLHAEIGFRSGVDGRTASRSSAQTTAGRLLFEDALPGRVCQPVRSRRRRRSRSATWRDRREPLGALPRSAEVAESLDAIKDLCYRYASQSGLTISIADVKTPPEKKKILDDTEQDADKVETQFRRGIITDGERRQKEVRSGAEATAQVQDAMERLLKAEQFNPIDMMVGSGARGNMMQVAPDRRHARPRGQPSRRHDPPPDQVELP